MWYHTGRHIVVGLYRIVAVADTVVCSAAVAVVAVDIAEVVVVVDTAVEGVDGIVAEDYMLVLLSLRENGIVGEEG